VLSDDTKQRWLEIVENLDTLTTKFLTGMRFGKWAVIYSLLFIQYFM
jgi:hypothetical protein